MGSKTSQIGCKMGLVGPDAFKLVSDMSLEGFKTLPSGTENSQGV